MEEKTTQFGMKPIEIAEIEDAAEIAKGKALLYEPIDDTLERVGNMELVCAVAVEENNTRIDICLRNPRDTKLIPLLYGNKTTLTDVATGRRYILRFKYVVMRCTSAQEGPTSGATSEPTS